MSAPTPNEGNMSRAAKVGLGIGGAAVSGIAFWGGLVAAGVALLALLGTPLFAIMGGSAELAWLLHKEAEYRHLRFISPPILDAHFSDSPILVTIPLFTFVGYVLAEAKTADRLVRAARSYLGWLPGGLAIVAVVASAVFTLLTGGSGVTIIAIGGLLYPALRKQKYSEAFALGLVTTGGSVGLLLPYSLPLLVFALVAHVDFAMAFKAVVVPGLLVIVLLSLYAAYIGVKEKVVREPPRLAEMASATWALKWELLIPLILMVGLGSGLASIDESAALVAAFTVLVEFFVIKDLSFKKDLGRITKASMAMAGAIIMILAMANAIMAFVVDQRIPTDVLNFLLKIGIEKKWQFLIMMNVFLLVLGMLMEGFSAILVAVPLLLPFVADLGIRRPEEFMSPFQLGMIFILNLEIAYCMPPLGLNLFIASFRFNRPVASLYKVVLPFAGILTFALVLVSAVPWFSNVGVAGDIEVARAKAAKEDRPPREAWLLECVQNDPTDPKPCTPADRAKWPDGRVPEKPALPTAPTTSATPAAPCNPDFGPCTPAPATGGSAEPCNPDFGPCTPAPAGSAPPKAADCNPDFGPCDPKGTPAAPSAPAAKPEDCNPDFGPCPPKGGAK